ncbi:MAG: TGS domain-containing protein [Betaproteobacteria bacterium]|nr:TGS domain-containing protein [Betaproteobacteria bacterium]
MPANLSPEYKAAEAAFRKARDPRERLDGLREMLRTIPKHKGTDHLQADIKSRIKELSEELEAPKKGGAARSGPPLVIRPQGAAQLALIGPPNSGKSSLHARLTGSHAQVAPYPFTTRYPEPGMMPHEDVYFELVDLPAVSAEHPVPWLAGTLQTADACLLVVDLSESSCVEQVQALHAVLRAKRVTLTDRWDAAAGSPDPGDDDPFALKLPALMLANKADLAADEAAEVEVFRELTGFSYPALAVSATTGQGLNEVGAWLFGHLGIVRVYTKAPGKPAEKDRPFTLRRGGTVEDVARLVHKDLTHSLKYARVWGKTGIQGQHVGREHPLADGDVVELHT